MEVDAAIGPAIDPDKSNPETGYVEIIEKPGVIGAYIELDKRFRLIIVDRLVTEEELRRRQPVEFEDIFQKARTVLPRTEK